MRRVTIAIIAILLGTATSGCVGYRSHYDLDADRYEDALRQAAPLGSQKTARYTLNVACYTGYKLVEAVSKPRPKLDALAQRTITDMGIFEEGEVGQTVKTADYHFIFDIEIRSTQEPGTFSGLILPFFRGRKYTARLEVLDEKGQPFANYAASAETLYVRHPLFLLFTPFYWPGWAENRARENLFQALSVRLIADRKEFL